MFFVEMINVQYVKVNYNIKQVLFFEEGHCINGCYIIISHWGYYGVYIFNEQYFEVYDAIEDKNTVETICYSY